MKYMGMLMVVLYIVLGIAVLESTQGLFNLPEPYAVIFGIVLILYGLFRAYRIYQQYFRNEP